MIYLNMCVCGVCVRVCVCVCERKEKNNKVYSVIY